jgi:hypothetical protein
MWIVRLALRRPYTFVVAALALMLLGVVTISRMPTDIFPVIDIPVVSVIWSFAGISPEDMEKRVVTISERAFTTTVNDLEHIESQSMQGVAVIKVFFQPGARIEAAVAQLTSVTQTILRVLPPGITPPLIIQYSASNVPILQIGVSSQTLGETAHPSHPGWCSADCDSGVCLHAVDLHRLRAGGLSDRRRPVAVHAAGDGGGSGDDGLLPAIADIDPDAREVPPAQ